MSHPGPTRPGVAARGLLVVWIALGVSLQVVAWRSGAVIAAPPPGAPSAEVAVVGDLISARLSAQPRLAVLEEIARQSGIPIVVRGALGAVRPQAFDRLPLAEGIRRVIGDHALLMIHGEGRVSRIMVRARLVDGAGTTTFGGDRPSERAMAPGSSDYLDDRRHAIGELVQKGGADGVRGLSRMLQEDPDPTVRRLATNALLNLSAALAPNTAWKTQAARAFGDALKDERAEVRLEAIRGLGLVHGHVATPILARAAIDDEAPEVRRQALFLLAQSQGSSVRTTLDRSLLDPSPRVRGAAAQILASRRGGQPQQGVSAASSRLGHGESLVSIP